MGETTVTTARDELLIFILKQCQRLVFSIITFSATVILCALIIFHLLRVIWIHSKIKAALPILEPRFPIDTYYFRQVPFLWNSRSSFPLPPSYSPASSSFDPSHLSSRHCNTPLYTLKWIIYNSVILKDIWHHNIRLGLIRTCRTSIPSIFNRYFP